MQAKDVKDSHTSLNLTQNWTRRKSHVKRQACIDVKGESKEKVVFAVNGEEVRLLRELR